MANEKSVMKISRDELAAVVGLLPPDWPPDGENPIDGILVAVHRYVLFRELLGLAPKGFVPTGEFVSVTGHKDAEQGFEVTIKFPDVDLARLSEQVRKPGGGDE